MALALDENLSDLWIVYPLPGCFTYVVPQSSQLKLPATREDLIFLRRRLALCSWNIAQLNILSVMSSFHTISKIWSVSRERSSLQGSNIAEFAEKTHAISRCFKQRV
jgi:hypothetical protein